MNETNNALAERLQSLPDIEPPADGWQRLRAGMERRARPMAARRRRAPHLAAAASLLLAMATGWVALETRTAPSAQPGPDAASSRLTQLIARSADLERELDRARRQTPVWDTQLAVRAAAYEQGLQLVDLQLGYAAPGQAQALWESRVRLMRGLVETHRHASLAAPQAIQAMTLENSI